MKDKDGMAACGCREACTTVEYQAHVSTFHFPSHSLVLSQNITPGKSLLTYSPFYLLVFPIYLPTYRLT